MVNYHRTGMSIDRGLVGHWKLDDLKLSGATKAIDQANFNDGTLSNCTDTTGVNSSSQNATLFNGTNASIATTDGSLFKFTNNFAIMCWIRGSFASGSDVQPIFGQASYEDGEGASFGYSFQLLGEVVGIGTLKFGYNNEIVVAGTSQVPLTGWHYVGIVLRAGILEFYIDGVLDKSSEIGAITQFNAIVPKIGLGTHSSINDQYFKGSISNLRVYNRPITQGEISKLHRLKL